jgi:sugar lactone lactonase YvrE
MIGRQVVFTFAIWAVAASARAQITTVAGDGTLGFGGDGGAATSARLAWPSAVALDGAGHLFIADRDNQRIRQVDLSTGVITTLAGNGVFAYAGDGGPAASASLFNPQGLAADGNGHVFIADTINSRIRQVDLATGIITTVAGNGTTGYGGDGGAATAASLFFPFGVAVDSSGNIFIADSGNQRVRRIDLATGIITTIAGTGTLGYGGDGGPATAAELFAPDAVAVDATGRLFIADSQNNRVRQVDLASGVITTVAGNGTFGFSGDFGLAVNAQLGIPDGVAVDGAGHLLIADHGNARVRQVDLATGIIVTVAGNGVFGFSGDGGAAVDASFASLWDVAIDGAGRVYIADAANHRIRRFTRADHVVTRAGFYQPVNSAAAVVNTVKAGSTVPLRFNVYVDGVEKTDTAGIQFSVVQISCDGGPEDPVDFVTSGATTLSYNGHQFAQNWQTPKTPGACYIVRMTTAADGGSLSAVFKMK